MAVGFFVARESSAKRGYNARWQKARATYLREHPVCAYCARFGRLTPASVVDHVIPHKGDSRLFWDSHNWQPLCAACHDGAKRAEERGGRGGCDLDGLPATPAHHWRANGGGGRNFKP